MVTAEPDLSVKDIGRIFPSPLKNQTGGNYESESSFFRRNFSTVASAGTVRAAGYDPLAEHPDLCAVCEHSGKHVGRKPDLRCAAEKNLS